MAHIHLHNVSVEFPVYNVSARSFKKKFLKLATGGRVMESDRQYMIVSALNNISFHLNHGDQVGLIGHNGAGKSTLLRLLAQIYEPTQGYMHTEGHVSPMLDIAQGIESEFTGYENIALRGTLLGLSQTEIKDLTKEIAELSGLGDYLSMPLRTYSSGMSVRLSFAISASIKPEILLIDEVFGAGDASFMEIARAKMVSLLNQSSIVVMANHSDDIIKEFCNKVILLEGGKVKYVGDPKTAYEIYHS